MGTEPDDSDPMGRRLEAHLTQAAAEARLTPSVSDAQWRGRARGLRRRAAVGMSVTAIVAVAAGFGLGVGSKSGGGGDNDSGAASPVPTQPSPETTGAARPDPESTMAPDAVTSDTLGADEIDGGMRRGPYIWSSGGGGGPLITEGWSSAGRFDESSRVDRTTAEGFRVSSVRGTDDWETTYESDSGWHPQEWCHGNNSLQLIGIGESFLTTTEGELFPDQPPEIPVRGVVTSAGANGDVTIMAVQTFGGYDTIRLIGSEGAVDEAPVSESGLTPLAVTDPAQEYTLELDGRDGTIGLGPGAADQSVGEVAEQVFAEGCEPPQPKLPEPGEQPADPEAAEAEVREHFDMAYDHSMDPDVRPDYVVDDWTGIADAWEQALDGSFSEAAEAAELTIDEVVFTAPDEAWFRYSISTTTGVFDNRFGTAHLIDGHWSISRATICQDLSLAGAPCDPPSEPVVPPGYEDPISWGSTSVQSGTEEDVPLTTTAPTADAGSTDVAADPVPMTLPPIGTTTSVEPAPTPD